MVGGRLWRRVFGSFRRDNVSQLPARLPTPHRLRVAHQRRATAPGRPQFRRLRRRERHQLPLRLRRRQYHSLCILASLYHCRRHVPLAGGVFSRASRR